MGDKTSMWKGWNQALFGIEITSPSTTRISMFDHLTFRLQNLLYEAIKDSKLRMAISFAGQEIIKFT